MLKRSKRMMCSLVTLTLIASLTLTSCQEDLDEASESPQDSFGLPGKGDQTCDPKSALCWSGEDAERARTLMDLESQALLGEIAPSRLIIGVRELSHKMTEAELVALDELDVALSAIPADDDPMFTEERARVMKLGFERSYGRVISSYWGAHSTLFGEVMSPEQTSVGKSDNGSEGGIPSSLPMNERLRPALSTLWSQGPLGQYMVTMLTLTGSTKFEVSQISITEREIGAHDPIDVDSQDLVNHYSRAAVIDSFFANMASLIPVAGVWISVPYGVFAQFKQRARLAIELGSLYGLDPQDPNDFLVIVQSMITAQGFKEIFSAFYKSLIGAQGYRMISGRGGNQFLVGENEFSERRVEELIRLGIAQVGIYGVRIFTSIQAKITGSTLKSLLGQVTFGVTALADITVDYFTINSMGRELRYMLHPWGWATYLEGMPLLADENYRRCAHAALIEVARADGDVNELEAMLMQEALLRPFSTSDSPEGANRIMPYSRARGAHWVAFTNRDQILEQANFASDLDPFRCLGPTWAQEDSFTQLSLLAWLELMAHTDSPSSEREDEYLQALGSLFSVSRDESRVYDAMRERVASYPRTSGYVSASLWGWSAEEVEEIGVAISDETRREIWRVMR